MLLLGVDNAACRGSGLVLDASAVELKSYRETIGMLEDVHDRRSLPIQVVRWCQPNGVGPSLIDD